ncbi:hypothetical protein AB4298_19650 [Shewanella sp. 10N.261.52.F9]|uniref:hypothetical protein n=1 Tax=Shewanella sp. 10N.261.52.F9 TaxID=3229684 RepID=UPI003553344C
MKRKLLVISCTTACIVGGYYFYVFDKQEKTTLQSIPIPSTSLTSRNEMTEHQQTLETSVSSETAQQTKLVQLTSAHAQCQKRYQNFSEQVADIHNVIIAAIELELQQGKTDRELLAYRSQYKTFYDSYQDLLIEAKSNNERNKYVITQSSSILKDWSGLSVIEGFNTDTIAVLAIALKPLENENPGLGMIISLAQDINKADIYALLDNTDHFTTYLESPLYIADSAVLSPSILFILTAEKLNIEEYKQAVALHSFTVNEVGIAIQNNMATEYLIPLLEQTKSLADFPIFAQKQLHNSKNLADIAAANFNVDALTLLAQYGVKPINEPGILTAMDIAILNLPYDNVDYNKLNPDANKILDTLIYLKAQGYKAHGKIKQLDNLTITVFKAPRKPRTNSEKISNPKLKSLLNSISLIDNSFNIKQQKADDSVISLAIAKAKSKQMAMKQKSEQCTSVKQQLLAEQSFKGRDKAYDIIKEIEQDPTDVKQRLHDIDPVLVGLWQEHKLNFRPAPLNSDSSDTFERLIADGKIAQARDYSAHTPLTLSQTDILFRFMLRRNIDLLSVWKARVSPLAPTDLMYFKNLPIEKWQGLLDQGFDFLLVDQLGRDVFMAAALHSPQALQFLVDNNFKLNVDKHGLDALDTLLEASYENGQLHENLPKLLSLYPKFRVSHYARVARIKTFLPKEYQQLIAMNKALTPPAGAELNKYRSLYF